MSHPQGNNPVAEIGTAREREAREDDDRECADAADDEPCDPRED